MIIFTIYFFFGIFLQFIIYIIVDIIFDLFVIKLNPLLI